MKTCPFSVKGDGVSDFSIYQDGIFKKLRYGHGLVEKDEFFYWAIKEQVSQLAARCNMRAKVSPTRIAEVQDLWEKDMIGLIDGKKIEDSVYPCEFKHAAFLCFWLRRRLIIETIEPIDPTLGIVDRDFNSYKNEYVAFYISLHLVLFHHYRFSEDSTAEDIKASLHGYRFPNDLAREILVMLHHKNVSPHALYLLFKALVTTLPPPKLGRKATKPRLI